MMSNAREDRKKLKDRIYCEVNIRPILTLNIVGSIELKSWMVGSIEWLHVKIPENFFKILDFFVLGT